jgi:hypothetical protein
MNSKNKFFSLCIILLLANNFIYAADHGSDGQDPLFAGTLLAIYAKNPKAGHSAIQPYVFFNKNYGFYNKNSKLIDNSNIYRDQLFLAFQTGITDNFAIGIFPNIVYAHSKQEEFFNYGDTIVFLAFQVANDRKNSWVPDCRILIEESFPTGKYKNLASPIGLDASGSGSYETSFIFITRKIFYDTLPRPFNFNLNLYYILSSQSRVSGINVYGGDMMTQGIVHPGNQFLANLAFEYSLSHHWGCGIDVHFEHQNTSHFSSKKRQEGLNGLFSWDRISLAPCIEYNFNENFNIIGGAWLSIYGRNATAFMSYGATLYYYF